MSSTDSAPTGRRVRGEHTAHPTGSGVRPPTTVDERMTRGTRPRPDAPLRSVGRLVTALLHAGVLLGIAGLLLWYVMRIPELVGRQALVSVVASSLVEIRTPTEGIFVAATDLPAGTRVKKGQLLGHVRAPRLAATIKATENRLDALLRRKLLLETPDDEVDRPEAELDRGREFRECVEKIVATSGELDQLRGIERDLRIVSPVSGQIQYRVSGSTAVTADETVAHLWPEGGELVVEVRAPLNVVHELVRENHVEARFLTPRGTVQVTACPIPGSLQVTAPEQGTGRKKELWGFVQCRALSIPEPVAHPGSVGTL